MAGNRIRKIIKKITILKMRYQQSLIDS